MATKSKSKKTALKRIRSSKPRGNKRPKLIYKQSSQGHLKTKRSRKSKRRQSSRKIVDNTIVKKYKKVLPV